MNAPPIPEQGLAEVLSRWVGRGSLWDVLDIPPELGAENGWSSRDLEARAHRVLLEKISEPLLRWPTRLNTWLDLLPAARTHATMTDTVPFAGVSWPKTFIRFGWPPAGFVGRQAQRDADTLLVTSLRWTLQRVLYARETAARLYPDIDVPARLQLDVARALLDSDLLAAATPSAPARQELIAIRREGAPWGAVAEVAEEFLLLDTSLDAFVGRLLIPDDEIRWRLFHLGVLGVTLQGLVAEGCKITSLRPLSAASNGPAYAVEDPAGRRWELWFEASGLWRDRGTRSPYQEATAGISGIDRSLGADIVLIHEDKCALVIECKYSGSREFVARAGYYQAMTYAAELRSRLSERVVSVGVGPEGVVSVPTFVETVAGTVGLSPPGGIPRAIVMAMTL